MVGIENLKMAIVGAAKGSSAIFEIMEDGSVGLSDLGSLPDIFTALRQLAGVEWSAIDDELKDIDDAEKDELAAIFEENFDIEADDREALIEQGFALVLMAAQAIMAFMTVGAQVKK